MHAADVINSRFTIEHVAGKGGMGTVYRAYDAAEGASVALKLLHGTDASGLSRFDREARVLSELDHPGIVRYVDHGHTPTGEPYLAMEWLDGEDLAHRLARASLSVDETILLARRTAEALAAAHARGVVHRDIKPSNLFLQGGAIDRVKVLDFGIARLSDATQVLTGTGVLVGTPTYMAPEQVRAERGVDSRADVFALGGVLFECLTGRPPFDGAHPTAVLAKILFEPAPRLRSIRPEVPKGLDELVARMLAKEPTLRLPDGAAVVEAVAALDAVTPPEPTAMPESLTSRERQLISVVLLGRDRPLGVGTTHDAGRTDSMPELAGLIRAARARGGQLELLADGSLVVSIARAGSAVDQAAQAARCALSLRALAPVRPMSLATGRADLGAKLPVGDAIDRAARMLSSRSSPAAVSAPISIDDVTAGLLDARFEVRGSEAGPELHGELEAIVDTARLLLGKPTPYVGRDRELAMLEAVLAECVADGEARAVLVSGVAGIGKSRLRHEFVRASRRRVDSIEPWIAAGDPMRTGSTLGLVAQILRCAIGVLGSEPLDVSRERLRAHVERRLFGEDAARVTEFLGEIMGNPFPDDGRTELRAAREDPMLMGDQMRRAWEDFLSAECAAGPVVLVIEDLQWSDLSSIEFIDAALRTQHERPLMVLATARPELHELFADLWAERALQTIRLGELSRKASERLVRQVLGDAISTEVVERAVTRAAGNAFYLEELIRAEAEGKGEAPPDTVLAMVQARLAALPPEARRVIRAGSVFGEAFWEQGVGGLLGASVTSLELADLLAMLVHRELIVSRAESRFPGQREYAFRHALVRDGAYDMLTESDRALGHRLAGTWLEQAGEEDPAVLAEHFERGGERARAAELYIQAMEQALEANDFVGVLVRAERAIACGAGGNLLGRPDAALRETSDALVFAEALHASGALEQAREAIAALRTLHLFRAGKMTDPAARRRYLEDVPEHALALRRAARWLPD